MINQLRRYVITPHHQILLYSLIGLAIVVTMASYLLFAEAGSIKSTVFSVNSSPYDIPFSEWAIKWWQWHISIPKAEHPRANPSSTHCPVGEAGPVSFVTHSIQGYSELVCTIPAEKAILMSISSGECDSDEIKSGDEVALRKCASEGNDRRSIPGNSGWRKVKHTTYTRE